MIGADKLAHLFAGFFVAAMMYPLFGVTIAFLLTVVAGFGKEGYDYYRHANCRKDVEFADIIATILGGVVFVCYLIFWSWV